jgi:hypothetical protein
MATAARHLSQAGAGDAGVDHDQPLDEENDAPAGQAADNEEDPGDDQEFCQARQKEHHFALAFFQDPVSLPD